MKIEVDSEALQKIERMVQKLQDERDMLLNAAQLGLQEAEGWVYDQLEGTSNFNHAMDALQPIRDAIAKTKGETK